MKAVPLTLSSFAIILLNLIIYWRAKATIIPVDQIFAECARNSGRTSAAINMLILLFIGYYGLSKIFKDHKKKTVLLHLTVLFAINHLIHFYFVANNFQLQKMTLSWSENLHGVITFVGLALLPLVLRLFKQMNVVYYWGVVLHLLNVTYFLAISFYGRYKPGIDEAYLHRIGVLVMIMAVIYILQRAWRDTFPKPTGYIPQKG